MIAAMLMTLAVQAAAPLPLSAVGRAALDASIVAEDARRSAMRAQVDAAEAAVAAAASTRPLDLAQLSAALEARDALDVERLRNRTATGVALLERLSPADRAVVAPLIAGAARRGPPPAGALPPPAPPPPR